MGRREGGVDVTRRETQVKLGDCGDDRPPLLQDGKERFKISDGGGGGGGGGGCPSDRVRVNHHEESAAADNGTHLAEGPFGMLVGYRP